MQRNYRGQRVDTKDWAEGYYTEDPDLGLCYIQGWEYWSSPEGLQRAPYIFEVIPETVGQYTGLKDKNGKEAWHKDVLKDKYKESENFGVIEQELDSCNLYIAWNFKRKYDGKEYWDTNELPLWRVKEYVIVGNCFDNPELLQEEQCHQ
jgi:uncharacterized phage protein (TIGR01671 family)